MTNYELNVAQTRSSAVEVNKVLKNTYLLLGLTLAFSAMAQVRPMIEEYPLDRAAEAFAVAADKSSGAIKVQLHP